MIRGKKYGNFLLRGLIVTILLAACAVSSPSPQPKKAQSQTNKSSTGFIFTSTGLEQGGILTADLDEFTVQPFSDNTNTGKCPAYSPDGSLVAFCNEKGGISRLFVVRSDGSEPKELTDAISGCTCGADAPLSWSPDGKWIMLPDNQGKDPNFFIYDIFIVSKDGRKVINLTKNPQRYGGLVWNPDSRSILFSGMIGEKSDIYKMTIHDLKISPLTTQPMIGEPTEWSPDGNMLLIFADSGGGNFDIYVFEEISGKTLRLTDSAGFDSYPHWSPDGQKIIFISKRDGEDEIYSMNADGSIQENLTENPAAMDIWPSISRNGRLIVYLTSEDNQWKTIIMNADGNNKKDITDLVGIAGSISWRP